MGHAPDGIRLLADVTTSPSHSYRQAHIVRLMAAVLRAARTLGETLTFEVAGARLWRQVRDQLAGLMEGFRGAGALAGATAEEAYQVRCDRTTMTQNDIDNGRVIAELQFDPAAAVEAITVVLSLHEGGRVSLVEHQS
jgi:phage tail sheath protein FI